MRLNKMEDSTDGIGESYHVVQSSFKKY
jgi:hypothetical protein